MIRPSHIDVADEAFTPSLEEITWARQVIAAFVVNPLSGAMRLDGKMIDKPHERMAWRILDQAGEN